MDNENLPQKHRHQLSKISTRGSYPVLRNWLNLIFMVGALAGMCTYFIYDHTVGTIVILASMLFKIIECALRFIH